MGTGQQRVTYRYAPTGRHFVSLLGDYGNLEGS